MCSFSVIPTSFVIRWTVTKETERLVESPAVNTLPYSHLDVFIHELLESSDVFWNSSGQFTVVA